MARSYQVSCPPGTKATIADLTTTRGGSRVTIYNSHATEGVLIGGDENEIPGDGIGTLSGTTGMKISAGTYYTTVIDGNEVIWGRGATSTVTITVHVFRTNARV